MKFAFWKKRGNVDQNQSKSSRPNRHKELPEKVGRYLVVQKNYDPDWVWSLRCIERRQELDKNMVEIRIFDKDTTQINDIAVTDYDSLNDYPDYIIFEGWYHKFAAAIHLESKLRTSA